MSSPARSLRLSHRLGVIHPAQVTRILSGFLRRKAQHHAVRLEKRVVSRRHAGAFLGAKIILRGEGTLVGEVVARTAIELHPPAVLASDQPEAVVFYLVQPRLAGRWLRGGCRKARRDETRREGTRRRGHG
jgi:hypothetical protein